MSIETVAQSPRLSTTANRLFPSGRDCTEVVIQRHLDRLAGATDEPAASAIVRDLLAGAANRLHWLCAACCTAGIRA